MQRSVVVVLVLVAIAAAALLWWAQQPAPEKAAAQPGSNSSRAGQAPAVSGPSVEARGAEIEQKDKTGKVLWKLKISGTFTTDKALGSVKGKDVQWDLVQAGQKTWRAVAPDIEVNYAARHIKFPSGARMAASDGSMSFEAGRIEYQMDSGKIVCSGRPTMKLRSGHVRATEFVVDTQRHIVSARAVRARYTR
ncbi:MAG: hypothetical protein N2512_12635 [Armatimonadetes bacterium]|nr:hypothetical protein [Armatimonadota bacterium]